MSQPSPAHTAADARNRAWRTLLQGLAVDVAAAILAVLVTSVSSTTEWTRAYWVALGLACAKSAVVALVSYLARRMLPPAV